MILSVATANAASGRDQHSGAPAFASWAAAAAELGVGGVGGVDGVDGVDGVGVLAVQEVDHLLERSGGADQTALLAAALGADGPAWTGRFAAAVHGSPGSVATMRPASSTLAEEPSYGVALLSRHPVLEWHELRMRPSRVRLPVPLPPGAGRRVLWVPDEQRVALAGVVATPAGDLTVVCTHLSFAPVRAVGQLRELVAWAAPLPRPLLLLGDLNLPGLVPARVTGWTPLARAATYPSTRPRLQLDHLLLDDPAGSLRPVSSTSLVLAAGDHRALRADLAPA